MMFLWIIILIIIVIAIWYYIRNRNTDLTKDLEKDPDTLLKQRLARGEITEEEFERQKRKINE